MRRALQVLLAVLASIVLIAPASARQFIPYEGTTSAPTWNQVSAGVLKKDSGRRFLDYFYVRLKTTCEDATTDKWGIGISGGRLGGDGEFGTEYSDTQFYFRIDGAISWGKGSGTAEFNWAKLTADGQDAQLCTSGDLTWTVDRLIPDGSAPNRAMPEGVGLLKLRLRHGVAEVVKFVEP